MKPNRIAQSHNRTKKRHQEGFIFAVLLCITISSLPATAQPSSGPYGPIWQNYDLPEIAGRIYYVAPDGDAEAPGKTLEQPTTLETAVKQVVSGDAIVLRGGIYRTGNLTFNQGIIIQSYADEHPILKGTEIATQWQSEPNGVWKTSWSHLFPEKPASWWRQPRFGREIPLCLFNNDMVFVDGTLLTVVGQKEDVDENSYYIDYDEGQVYIGTDPNDRMVEITAFDNAFVRTIKDCHGKTSDGKGPVVRGITFTQYAYRAIEVEGNEPEGLSEESKHGKDVTGTTFEHCTISYCSRVAAYLRGDKLTVRHCLVSDTSTEGLYVIGSADVLLEKNIFRRNNIENMRGYFPAAVKIFNQCYRTTCRDNLVIEHPNSNGIWYDVGNVDGRIINNWFQGVGSVRNRADNRRPQARRNAFFIEISKGAICAYNVFVNCSNGICVLNSSDVKVYQNTLINSPTNIGRDQRSAVGDHFGWHPSTGPDVYERYGHEFVNNLLTCDEKYSGTLLQINQRRPSNEQLDKPQLTKLDHNVYVHQGNTASQPLISWSQAPQRNLNSPEDLHKLRPEYSAHSQSFPNYDGPLFKCTELGNYELLKAFPGSSTGIAVPAEIQKITNQKRKSLFPGAYAPH